LQAGSNGFSPYLLILFLSLGLAFMGLIGSLIGILSGWHLLSRRFRAEAEPYGETHSAGPFFYHVQMRYRVNYGSLIHITAANDALYLSALFPFHIGHPPLCIPWKEVQLRRTRFSWRRYVVLTLGVQERIPMRISERMARKLGILDRVPGGSAFDVEPNFDQLPDDFPDPTEKKSN
jgi:hypothetical protein